MFKKLKKLFIFILVLPLAFAFAGCKKKNNGGSNNGKPPSQQQPVKPEAPVDPEDPETPVDPEDPENPVDPEDPNNPEPEVQTFSASFDYKLPEGYEFLCSKVTTTKNVGENVNLPTVADQRLSVHFLGWFDESNQKVETTTVTGTANQELKFTGKWNETGLKNYYYSEGLTFAKTTDSNENEIAEVVSYTGNSQVVIVPKYFVFGEDEFPVRKFKESSFEEKAITSVIYHADGVIVGEKAFKTSALSSFNFDKVAEIGAYAFANTQLEELVVPASIQEIGEGAFSKCLKLSSVDFSANTILSSVSQAMFLDDENLETVKLSSKISVIDVSAFSGCLKLSDFSFVTDKIVEICEKAFAGCGFEEVSVPSNVVSFGVDVFDDCSKLKTLKLYSLFNPAESENFNTKFGSISATLVEIDLLGDKITIVPEYYFQDCIELKRVVLADSIEIIGEYAFSGCNKLISINFPTSLNYQEFKTNSIQDTAFYTGITDGLDINGVRLLAPASVSGEVVIPNTITTILDGAYRDNKNITSVKIPSSVEVIGERVFYGCTNLQSVIFEENSKLTEIKSYTFYGCEKLASINLNNCLVLSTIGENAFSGIKATIADFKLPTKLETIGRGVFYNSNIQSYSIGASSTHIDVVDGVVYNKEKTTIYAYPNLKTDEIYVIPATVSRIEEFAFTNNKNLKAVYVSSDDIVFGKTTGISNVFKNSGVGGVGTIILSKKDTVSIQSYTNEVIFELSSDLFEAEYVEDEWVVELTNIEPISGQFFIVANDGEKDVYIKLLINVSGETSEIANLEII
ncbi:MAG: leucine-rich repeat protein [Clostridia bacterium]|nr:leucine-rich repeat protein [Clostridia bacterium]